VSNRLKSDGGTKNGTKTVILIYIYIYRFDIYLFIDIGVKPVKKWWRNKNR